MRGRILCFLGIHEWIAPLKDYIDEFGGLTLDGRVPKTAKCKRCGKKYNKD